MKEIFVAPGFYAPSSHRYLHRETIVDFKKKLRRFMLANGKKCENGILYVDLDIRLAKDRIHYPRYSKVMKSFYGGDLEYLGCPVKVIVMVPEKVRHAVSGVLPEDMAHECNEQYYGGDLFLMYPTLAVGGKAFQSMTDEQKYETIMSVLKDDVLKIDQWGHFPVTLEFIPELVGVLPEYVYPSTDASLMRCLDKIKAHAIL